MGEARTTDEAPASDTAIMTVTRPNVTNTTPPRGPELFGRYAYPPNALGYCGPDDPAALLELAAAGGHFTQLSHMAAQFEGAWPYLRLIAEYNQITDPLDRRVVEAYWIGNELTWRVPATALANSLRDRFAWRAGRQFDPLVAAALDGGVPQHSFHVFGVYPWLGLLRSGRTGPPLEILDRCRIRWGTVEYIEGDLVTVRSRPLGFVGSRLVLDNERIEVVRQSLEGVGFVSDLAVGDVVALHWDWVCDRLTSRSFAWLRASTFHNLRAVNNLARPGPAVICDA
jgi:hypothetical protein